MSPELLQKAGAAQGASAVPAAQPANDPVQHAFQQGVEFAQQQIAQQQAPFFPKLAPAPTPNSWRFCHASG